MPTVRFSFDAGSGTVLWAGDEAALEVYPNYYIDLELLPVSRSLRDELLVLAVVLVLSGRPGGGLILTFAGFGSTRPGHGLRWEEP